MINEIVFTFARLPEEDPVGICRSRDLIRSSGEAGESRVKDIDIFRENFRCVPFRIDGYEHAGQVDSFRGQDINGRGIAIKIKRADVRTEGVTEIDQRRTRDDVRFLDLPPLMGNQSERTADDITATGDRRCRTIAINEWIDNKPDAEGQTAENDCGRKPGIETGPFRTKIHGLYLFCSWNRRLTAWQESAFKPRLMRSDSRHNALMKLL